MGSRVSRERASRERPKLTDGFRSQAASGSSDVAVQKPYDWTYTTLHPGSFSYTSSSQASTSSAPGFQEAPPSHSGIPLHLLARQDIPILFFDEVPLFEDELGDNGIAELVVRVVRTSSLRRLFTNLPNLIPQRVNATSVFVLSRFFLRVDHVLFRIFDVRLYHAFGSTEIIRETKGRQASYDSVKRVRSSRSLLALATNPRSTTATPCRQPQRPNPSHRHQLGLERPRIPRHLSSSTISRRAQLACAGKSGSTGVARWAGSGGRREEGAAKVGGGGEGVGGYGGAECNGLSGSRFRISAFFARCSYLSDVSSQDTKTAPVQGKRGCTH